MAKNRPNVIPIIEDARHPQKYRMLVPMVDAVFADVAQPDQVRTCTWIPLQSMKQRCCCCTNPQSIEAKAAWHLTVDGKWLAAQAAFLVAVTK